jgi:toxin-antitoxin system PIN domain toxin
MTAYLFDVNVLLAMFDPGHEHHRAARHWWDTRSDDEWCTCPITENGFLRIASGSGYPRILERLPDLIVIFKTLCNAPDHRYWPADVFLSDVVPPKTPITSAKTTDIYLLALAIAHGGKLATFDKHIPARMLPGGEDAIELIPA